jgi:hypothetical protein
MRLLEWVLAQFDLNARSRHDIRCVGGPLQEILQDSPTDEGFRAFLDGCCKGPALPGRQ